MRKAWWCLAGARELVACPEGLLHCVVTLEPTLGVTFNFETRCLVRAHAATGSLGRTRTRHCVHTATWLNATTRVRTRGHTYNDRSAHTTAADRPAVRAAMRRDGSARVQHSGWP